LFITFDVLNGDVLETEFGDARRVFQLTTKSIFNCQTHFISVQEKEKEKEKEKGRNGVFAFRLQK
jgi:hypothetical protein